MQAARTILIVSSDPLALERADLPSNAYVRVLGTLGEALGVLFGEGWGDMPTKVFVDESLPDGSGAALLRRLRRDSWLRGAAVALPLPLLPERVLEEGLTDDAILAGLSFAGIP